MKPGGSPGLIPLLYAQEFAAHGAIRSLGKPEKAERKTQMQNMHPNVRARRPTMSEHEAGAFWQERVGLAIYMRKSGMAERRFCHAFYFYKGGNRVEQVAKESLTEQELQLIRLIRELGYGELNITVKAGKPVHVNEIRRSIQLNG